MLERMRLTTASAFQATSANLLRSRRRRTVSRTSTPRSFMSTSRPTCLLSRPLSWRDRRYSTQLTISKQSSARLRGEANRAGCWWRQKTGPSNPDLERWYAARADSHKVEVPGASHSVYVSRPKEVAALIEEAASHAR